MAELITNYTPQGNSFADTLMTGMKMQYMQNQMAENEVQNALRERKMQQEEVAYQNDLLKFKRDSLAKIAPNEYGNWRQMIKTYDKHADLLLPQESDFMDDQGDGTVKFNAERFTNWQKRNIMTASDVLDKKGASWEQFWVKNSDDRHLPYYHKKGEPIDEAAVTAMFGPGWKFASGAEEKSKSESYDVFNLYGPKGQTKRVSVPKGEGYEPEPGWSLRAPEKPERLNVAEIKAARDMEMNSVMNRVKLDMSPEEQANFANMTPDQLMASILSGGGKSLPKDKKDSYIKEIKEIDDHYGKLSQNVLGRKGAPAKPEKAPAEPQKNTWQNKTINDLWSEAGSKGSSSAAVKHLMETYGYNEAQAKDIIKQGLSSGAIK